MRGKSQNSNCKEMRGTEGVMFYYAIVPVFVFEAYQSWTCMHHLPGISYAMYC